ncbi:MAG: Holliday junction resolvase RuvX [Chloroflexi bacterium]|nr:Holliday junction resolvase RuvX [Chloroflexota bacterium]
MSGRVLAVDPGEKRIGLAISDETACIANPLGVVTHTARDADAQAVARIAAENQAARIIVGQALDASGEVGPAARKAQRFADALRLHTDLPVELWDESGSTKAAQSARREMGVSRKKRSGHLDDLAAAIILQTYLDAKHD